MKILLNNKQQKKYKKNFHETKLSLLKQNLKKINMRESREQRGERAERGERERERERERGEREREFESLIRFD
jgi:hypothetical protein